MSNHESEPPGAEFQLDPAIARIAEIFEHKMNEERSTQVVLTAHQFVELHLNVALERALIRPEALDLATLGYGLKLSLAVALGCLDPDEAGAYKVLNKVRGRFAHDLEAQITDSDVRDLDNAVQNEKLRSLVENGKRDQMWQNGTTEDRFGWLSLLLAVHLNARRHASQT